MYICMNVYTYTRMYISIRLSNKIKYSCEFSCDVNRYLFRNAFFSFKLEHVHFFISNDVTNWANTNKTSEIIWRYFLRELYWLLIILQMTTSFDSLNSYLLISYERSYIIIVFIKSRFKYIKYIYDINIVLLLKRWS